MAISLPEGIAVTTANPVIASYGPWPNKAAALSNLSQWIRYPGMTAMIESELSEYWFLNGIADADFVEKLKGGEDINTTLYPNTAWVGRDANSIVTHPNSTDIHLEKISGVSNIYQGITATFSRDIFANRDFFISFDLSRAEIEDHGDHYRAYYSRTNFSNQVEIYFRALAGKCVLRVPYSVVQDAEFNISFGVRNTDSATFKNIAVASEPIYSTDLRTTLTGIENFLYPLARRNVVTLGASNTDRVCADACARLGASMVTYAVGSSTVADKAGTVHEGGTAGDNNVMSNQVVRAIAADLTNVAAIVCMFGGNDWQLAETQFTEPIEPTFTTNGRDYRNINSLNLIDNFKNSMRWGIQTLQVKYPYAQIYWCGPAQAGTRRVDADLKKISDCGKAMAQRLGISFIDIFGESGINGALTPAIGQGTHTVDGNHFSYQGSLYLADIIANRLRNDAIRNIQTNLMPL